MLRRIESAVAAEAPSQCERLSEEVALLARSTCNPVTAIAAIDLLPTMLKLRTTADHVRARARLLEAALALEQARRHGGRYPADPAELPADPCGGLQSAGSQSGAGLEASPASRRE